MAGEPVAARDVAVVRRRVAGAAERAFLRDLTGELAITVHRSCTRQHRTRARLRILTIFSRPPHSRQTQTDRQTKYNEQIQLIQRARGEGHTYGLSFASKLHSEPQLLCRITGMVYMVYLVLHVYAQLDKTGRFFHRSVQLCDRL